MTFENDVKIDSMYATALNRRPFFWPATGHCNKFGVVFLAVQIALVVMKFFFQHTWKRYVPHVSFCLSWQLILSFKPGVELSHFVHANRARVFYSKPSTPWRNWTRDRIVTKICCSNAGVPNLEYMYAQGYICLSEGVHLRLAIEEKKYIYMIFVSKDLYTYQWILFSKIIICLFLNISMNNHDKIFSHIIF